MSKEQLTIVRLEEILREELGINVEQNEISRAYEIEDVGNVFGEYDPGSLINQLPIHVYDYVQHDYRCNGKNTVADYLAVIANKNRYNPVARMLSYSEWDGKYRLPALYSALGITDGFYQILIKKWLHQSIALAFNDSRKPFGADGILVLNGAQGIGKTTVAKFFGCNNPKLYKLGQVLDTRDKDTMRRCLTSWIVELGELESTVNRSDGERLKAFITNETDEYRLPYDRVDTILPRRASLIATCNSDRFLNDITGSRRYWVVPIDSIDIDALNKIDAVQLWHEIKVLADSDPQGFRLTANEREELERRNSGFQKSVSAQDEVEDILHDAENNPSEYKYILCTVTDFKMQYNSLSKYNVDAIAKALGRCGIESDRKKVCGKSTRVRLLPMPKTYAAAVYSSSKITSKAWGDSLPF